MGLLPFFNFKNVTITLASKCARNCPNYIVTVGNRAVIKFIKIHFRESSQNLKTLSFSGVANLKKFHSNETGEDVGHALILKHSRPV